MADEIDAIVQRILEEEEEQDNKEEEQEEENKEVVKKEEEKNPDEDKRKRKNRRKKEKRRAAKDRKICAIYIQSVQFSIEQSVQQEEEKDKWKKMYIQSVQFSIEQSVQQEEEKDKWKKMWREIHTGKHQSELAGAGGDALEPHDVEAAPSSVKTDDVQAWEAAWDADSGEEEWSEFSKTEKRQSDSAGAGVGDDPPNLVAHDVGSPLIVKNVDNAGQPMAGEEQEDIEEEEKDKGKKVLREFPKTEKRQRLISGHNGSSEWEGKHKVLVRTRGHKSKYFVVDLQNDIIEMQNPYRLLGDGFLGSAAVFREEEDRMIVYEFGGREEDTFNIFKETKEDDNDHIILHSFSGTSKSILNLKTNPPTWSKWEDCRAKMTRYYWNISCSVTLGNKIFAFGGITQVGQVYDTSKNKPEWEDMTPPAAKFSTGEVTSRCSIVSHSVISDPKNNRLILYFANQCCLYAYYPDNDKESRWKCLDNDLETLPLWNQQLVDDVIYYFGPPYTFLAYDITQRKWLNVSWPEKKLQDCDMFFMDITQMIHLGDGIMCLAISYPPYAVIGHVPLLQFLRFRVSRVDDDHVQLTPISYHRFNTHPGQGWIFTPF